jgi:hypothetical protein
MDLGMHPPQHKRHNQWVWLYSLSVCKGSHNCAK